MLADVPDADAARLELALARDTGLEVDLLRLDELGTAFRARVERDGLKIHGF